MRYVVSMLLPPECEETVAYGLGSRYPHPGGLKENVNFFLGSVPVLQVEGEHEAYRFLDSYVNRTTDKPFLVDILNCQKGCLRGTGTDETIDDVAVELAINEMNNLVSDKPVKKVRSKIKRGLSPWNSSLSYDARWQAFDNQFADLNLDDFKRRYTNKVISVKTANRTEEETIYKSMLKETKEDRCVDCSCCGYSSCADMVSAIHNNVNIKLKCQKFQRKNHLKKK